jgi:hypothetical protein
MYNIAYLGEFLPAGGYLKKNQKFDPEAVPFSFVIKIMPTLPFQTKAKVCFLCILIAGIFHSLHLWTYFLIFQFLFSFFLSGFPSFIFSLFIVFP